MSRAICTNDIIMHIARNPRQVRIARKVQKAHIPRNMYPNGQNAMLCDSRVPTSGDILLTIVLTINILLSFKRIGITKLALALVTAGHHLQLAATN